MASIVNKQRVWNALNLIINGDPTIAPGVSASLNSIAWNEDSKIYKKIGSADTAWTEVAAPISTAQPNLYYVGTADYPTIQSAIDQAYLDGSGSTKFATILIPPGNYVENLILKPGQTLLGESSSNSISAVNISGQHSYTPPASGNPLQTQVVLSDLSFYDNQAGNTVSLLGTEGTFFCVQNCSFVKEVSDHSIFCSNTASIFVVIQSSVTSYLSNDSFIDTNAAISVVSYCSHSSGSNAAMLDYTGSGNLLFTHNQSNNVSQYAVLLLGGTASINFNSLIASNPNADCLRVAGGVTVKASNNYLECPVGAGYVLQGAGFVDGAGLVCGANSNIDPFLTFTGLVTLPQSAVDTASNLGAGDGLFAAKVGNDFQFKSLVAGSGITLTPSANDVTVSSSVTSTVPVRATAYVSKSGNDGTGVVGNLALPFLTIQAAINACVAAGFNVYTDPSIILIGPGVYTENLSLSPNVHLSNLSGALDYTVKIDGSHNYTVNSGIIGANGLDLIGIYFANTNVAANTTLSMLGTAPARLRVINCSLDMSFGSANPTVLMNNSGSGSRMNFYASATSGSISRPSATGDSVKCQAGTINVSGYDIDALGGNAVIVNGGTVNVSYATVSVVNFAQAVNVAAGATFTLSVGQVVNATTLKDGIRNNGGTVLCGFVGFNILGATSYCARGTGVFAYAYLSFTGSGGNARVQSSLTLSQIPVTPVSAL